MNLNLGGKRVLVTGGSRGVGRGIVLAFAAEGAHVAFSYHTREEAAWEVEREARALGVTAKAINADLTDTAEAYALYHDARTALGGIDILVNNAAIWPTNWFADISLEEWELCMRVNVTAPFLLSQAMVRDLRRADRPGRIVNITSQAAFLGSRSGHANYAASKAALVSMTVSLAREVASAGITVNAVALGLVNTEMRGDALERDKENYMRRIPLGRFATSEDAASVVLFLASPHADYITGATVDATGGMLMR
ncbi:3-oxoacyl-(acyl-carrier-protein) reductase FabG [uncultured delta proteobacterium]|uniref:3-oxoacyl-(Acyl-carrier-protein) reductase FabG n=1 Tax=uncultured delta proteobacterium TaxID=34034 RepID=A0A212JDW7_9DELT|nr:3-oxoacyl-(acyl-carrier-protein) reductase FabG [uncultured delta proteobacterium]